MALKLWTWLQFSIQLYDCTHTPIIVILCYHPHTHIWNIPVSKLTGNSRWRRPLKPISGLLASISWVKPTGDVTPTPAYFYTHSGLTQLTAQQIVTQQHIQQHTEGIRRESYSAARTKHTQLPQVLVIWETRRALTKPSAGGNRAVRCRY